MLLAEGVQLEEFGGDVPAVEVSGLTGQGLDNLMETVSLVAELKDIRAEQRGTAVGYVLESETVKGMGYEQSCICVFLLTPFIVQLQPFCYTVVN